MVIHPLELMTRRAALKGIAGIATTGVIAGSASAQPVRGNFERQLAAVRQATAKFNSVKKAEAAGYEYLNTVPGMGHHFLNESLVDGTLNTNEPEILVFGQSNAKNEPFLGGVEYVIPGPFQGETAPDLFNDEGVDLQFSEEQGWVGPNLPPVGLWALHAWVHTNNPNGVFSPFNSRKQFYPDPLE